MGQVPPKYFYPSAPYGSSDAVNALNSAQPAAINPQVNLLPPGFIDPGTTVTGNSTPMASQLNKSGGTGGGGGLFGNPRARLPYAQY